MPNPTRLVTQIVETISQQWVHEIGGSVKQKCDAFRMLRMNGEVKRLLLLNPGDTQRQRTTFSLLPKRTLRLADTLTQGSAPSIVHASRHHFRIVHFPSFMPGAIGSFIIWRHTATRF